MWGEERHNGPLFSYLAPFFPSLSWDEGVRVMNFFKLLLRLLKIFLCFRRPMAFIRTVFPCLYFDVAAVLKLRRGTHVAD